MQPYSIFHTSYIPLYIHTKGSTRDADFLYFGELGRRDWDPVRLVVWLAGNAGAIQRVVWMYTSTGFEHQLTGHVVSDPLYRPLDIGWSHRR